MKAWVTFKVLLPISMELFKRPRGGWLAYELQMIGHGLIGNGWDGVAWMMGRNQVED